MLIRADRHHGIGDAGAGSQHGGDFTGFNTEATDLDLVVITTEVIDGAVGMPAAHIACLVHPRIRRSRERIGQEALGGKVGAVQVTTRHTDATDINLTGHPDRHRLVVRIQQVNPAVGHRPANMWPGCLPVDARMGAIHGTFGRAVNVME